jgi:hypothetical protein
VFSLPTTFCPFLSTFSLCLYIPLLSFPNMSPHYPSFLHTYHLLTSLLYNCTQAQHPAIPDTSTPNYNDRNTPKHAQAPQNPAASIPLPQYLLFPLPLLVSPLPITQISVSSLITSLFIYKQCHSHCL